MALSGISPGSAANSPLTPQTDPRLLFMQLAKAITSGDLTGAQQAYSQLTQALVTGGPGGGANNPSDPFSQALSAIGQALQNDDINGAQQALAALQQQARASGRGHHHHHRGHASSGAANATSPPPAITNGTLGATIDVTA
jgi:hypothetical protein